MLEKWTLQRQCVCLLIEFAEVHQNFETQRSFRTAAGKAQNRFRRRSLDSDASGCHYNDEMPQEGVIRSSYKLFTLAIIGLACLFLPQHATAQRLGRQEPSVKPDGTDATKLAPGQPAKPATPPHAFWDRTNLLLFSGIAVTRGMDYASTRNFQARGRQEILLPDDVVNNSAGFASLEAAATLTSIGISYLLHRTGHHSLERWLSIGHIGVTAFGDVRNYSLESRHRSPSSP
jgi:hypothetical protein